MKYVCQVCGYVHEGNEAPEKCPVCNAPASKFTKQDGEMTWAAEHVVGIAKDVPEDIYDEDELPPLPDDDDAPPMYEEAPLLWSMKRPWASGRS